MVSFQDGSNDDVKGRGQFNKTFTLRIRGPKVFKQVAGYLIMMMLTRLTSLGRESGCYCP